MNALTRSLSAFWKSSIGKKFIVAVTGIIFVAFVAGHLAGNLLVFAGREVFNEYALFLHAAAHGSAVWVVRAILLASLVGHVAATVSLNVQNRRARERYQKRDTIQASKPSLTMMWSGLTVLAFIIYHLLHFTVRAANDYGTYIDEHHRVATGIERHDAWRMVIEGFTWGPAVLFYLIAMTLLAFHLWHGFGSMFQTLGLRSRRSASLIDNAAKVFAVAIWAGFISIPIAIYVFKFGR